MLQIKSSTQTVAEQLQDKVTAAMETGNHARAREVLAEMRDLVPEAVIPTRIAVIQDYGVAL